MIETLSTVLPLIIYFLLIILLIVVIVLGIKFIITVDKINNIINDAQEKIASFNSLFKVASIASEKISNLSGRLIDRVMNLFNKLLGLGTGKEDENDYE